MARLIYTEAREMGKPGLGNQVEQVGHIRRPRCGWCTFRYCTSGKTSGNIQNGERRNRGTHPIMSRIELRI